MALLNIINSENLYREFRNKRKTMCPFTISQYLEKEGLLKECIDWLEKKYPNETFAKKANSRTHIKYIKGCIKKRAIGKGYWDDSPKFFNESFGTLMSKTIQYAVHPEEDRFLNVREMMHLMGLPHDFEIDHVKNVNHIAQVRGILLQNNYDIDIVIVTLVCRMITMQDHSDSAR